MISLSDPVSVYSLMILKKELTALKTCPFCGAQIPDASRFCSACGKTIEPEPTKVEEAAQKIEDAVTEFQNTADHTAEFSSADIQSGLGLSVLAYLSILVLFPIFLGKKSPFVRFHANQGLLLFIGEVAYQIVTRTLVLLLSLCMPHIAVLIVDKLFLLVSMLFVVFAVWGIVNVVNGKAKELPLIGKIRLLQ